MSHNTLRSNYINNGYIHLKDFFDKNLIEEVKTDSQFVFYNQFKRCNLTEKKIDEIEEDEFNELLFTFFETDLASYINCGKQIQHLISLHKLSLNDKVQKTLKNLGLQFPNISTRPVTFFNHKKLSKAKFYHTVDPHQDWRSMQGSLNSIVIWVPLMDINKDLGSLKILPKSHKNGLKSGHFNQGFGFVELSEEEKKQLLTVEVKAGDALFFSSFLIHQSGENITNSPRWSSHFRFNDLSEITFVNRGYPHPYIYKPDGNLITENFPSISEMESVFNVKNLHSTLKNNQF